MIGYLFVFGIGLAIGAMLAWLRIESNVGRLQEQNDELDRIIDDLDHDYADEVIVPRPSTSHFR